MELETTHMELWLKSKESYRQDEERSMEWKPELWHIGETSAILCLWGRSQKGKHDTEVSGVTKESKSLNTF